jgi:hypothetical protein
MAILTGMAKAETFAPARRRQPLRAGPLDPARSQQILPLAQLLAPRLAAAELRRFAAAAAKAKGIGQGVLAVEDGRGYYLALSAFTLCPRLGKGGFLQVDDFVVLDMLGGLAAEKVMIEAIEGQARRNKCDGIDIVVPARPTRAIPPGTLAILAEHGFARVGEVYRKKMKPNGRAARAPAPSRRAATAAKAKRSPSGRGRS